MFPKLMAPVDSFDAPTLFGVNSKWNWAGYSLAHSTLPKHAFAIPSSSSYEEADSFAAGFVDQLCFHTFTNHHLGSNSCTNEASHLNDAYHTFNLPYCVLGDNFKMRSSLYSIYGLWVVKYN